MQPNLDKKHAIELLDRLSEGQLSAVVHLPGVMSRPARADDEPVTAEDARRIRDGQEWFVQKGWRGIPMSDLLAEFGLKAEDFPTGR